MVHLSKYLFSSFLITMGQERYTEKERKESIFGCKINSINHISHDQASYECFTGFPNRDYEK